MSANERYCWPVPVLCVQAIARAVFQKLGVGSAQRLEERKPEKQRLAKRFVIL
jgi:hypothetical protein